MNHNSLEELMARAQAGERQAAKCFYELLLKSEVYTAERFQTVSPSHQPEYPNDFFNHLAVKGKEDTVYVPFFSQREFALEWFETELKLRSSSTAELLKAIPADWHLLFNPGQEIEKDFTPWEIGQLNQGVESVDEILDELFEESELKPLNIEVPAANDYPTLIEELRKFATDRPRISMIHVVKENLAKPETGEYQSRAIVGIRFTDFDRQVFDEATNLARRAQIGNDQVKVFSINSDSKDNLFSLLEKFPPVFERPAENLLKRLLGRLRLR